MDRVNELLDVENKIADIYSNLINIEQNNLDSKDILSIRSSLFKKPIESLKKLLLEEEKLIKHLSFDELKEVKKTKGNPLADIIVKRIDGRFAQKYGIDGVEVTFAIHDDYSRYYLSFFDDYLDIEEDDELKKALIEEKYKEIFISSSTLEKRLIEEEFYTPKNVINESLFLSQVYGMDTNTYDLLRTTIAHGKLTDIFSEVKNSLKGNFDEERQKAFIYKCGFDAGLLLLTDDEIIHMFGEKFYEIFSSVIKENRERHLTLSLNKNIIE